ncbi:MAG: 5-(carboxyamino)imidazole ribonucleotide mutase [Phycisphaerae bacterium]
MEGAKSVIVGIILGSDSDMPTVEPALKVFDEFGLSYEIRALSAHRTPDEVAQYARTAADRGIKIIIAAAGMSAALPGTIAANTLLPVIGIPVASGALVGIDALLAISQMPPGVPVAAMTIGAPGAKNAALLTIRILALSDKTLTEKLKIFIKKQKDDVLARDKKIQTPR